VTKVIGSMTPLTQPFATGWASTFEGRPAVLWKPMIQVADASFGVRAHRFGFNTAGTTNIPLVVEASANRHARLGSAANVYTHQPHIARSYFDPNLTRVTPTP
jgi:hypothetical protein